MISQNKKIDAKKNYLFIDSATLVFFAFATAFYSRVFSTFGVPAVINFLHFLAVPFVYLLTLYQARSLDVQKNQTISLLNTCIYIFLVLVLISTFINDAGLINAFLAFMLWVEPILLIISILNLPTNVDIIEKLKKAIYYSFFIHTFLALIQNYGLHLYQDRGAQDNIQGIFYRSGAGHVVGASVALSFGVYFAITAQKYPLWMRIGFLFLTFLHMLVADAKQVLLTLLMGGIFLLVTKLKDIGRGIIYLLGAVIIGLVLTWCIQNLEAFSAFNTWIRPEIYGPDGEATKLKFATFRLIPTYYKSVLNVFFGVGPGHSVDRIGGWMLVEYSSLLFPLGATVHPASGAVWGAVRDSWLGDQSSGFSPLFGWAAIWGDFGILGLLSYLSIGIVLYFRVCLNDISKLLLFSVFAVGFIFSQMQEPGYMLSIAAILGLNWHEMKLDHYRALLRRKAR